MLILKGAVLTASYVTFQGKSVQSYKMASSILPTKHPYFLFETILS